MSRKRTTCLSPSYKWLQLLQGFQTKQEFFQALNLKFFFINKERKIAHMQFIIVFLFESLKRVWSSISRKLKKMSDSEKSKKMNSELKIFNSIQWKIIWLMFYGRWNYFLFCYLKNKSFFEKYHFLFQFKGLKFLDL